ncbi:MAG: HEAT repeat domain-containing protein [Rhodothermus sp.]|nr:HEAT repeat domain-containing protein [Rhodothermus sp.]
MLETIGQKLLELTFGDRLFRAALLTLYGLIAITGLLIIATVLLRWHNDRQQRRQQQREARWRPLLMAVLTGQQPPTALWNQVAPNEALDFCAFVYRFARRVRGSELATLHALVAPYLPRLQAQLFRGSPEKRAYRLQLLGVLGQGAYTQPLIQALDDPAPLVVLVAFHQLARPEHAHLAELLVDRLERLQQIAPSLLASLLAQLGFEALPALRTALLDASRPAWIRAILAEALSRLNDPHSAYLAAQLLRQKTLPPELTQALLRLIAHAGTSTQQAAILPYLQHPNAAIRMEAVRALGAIGDEQHLAILARSLSDSSPWVALTAARALKRRGALHLLQEAARHPRLRTLSEQVLNEPPILDA